MWCNGLVPMRSRSHAAPSSRLLILLWLSLSSTFCSSVAFARLDTLQYYDARRGFFYFRDPGIVMHAARFEPRSPGVLKEITVVLGGDSPIGGATVHVFGHEGGATVPLLEHDLVVPVRVAKTKAGLQEITIRLEEPVRIINNQLFIGVDGLTPGVSLMTNRTELPGSCSSSRDYFGFQYLKFADRSWKYTPYAYGISVVIEEDDETTTPYLTDVTAELGIIDSLRYSGSIAWADIDEDGYQDLLADGRLYRNVMGQRFEDITEQSNLTGSPRAGLFLDANNDHRTDILFLGSHDSLDPSSVLYLRSGDGSYVGHTLDIPEIIAPTSVAIADADGDGYLDLFVGQFTQDSTAKNYLLRNNHDGSFSDGSRIIVGDALQFGDCLGAEWVDYDDDGALDLFVRSGTGRSEVWRREGADRYSRRPLVEREDTALHGAGAGCHWADYDNDGVVDAMLPGGLLIGDAQTGEAAEPIFSHADRSSLEMLPRGNAGVEFEEMQTGGTWGDVDNDGLLDLITTTSGCECRYADIYLQRTDHTFELATYRFGMNAVPAGPDAIWVDYNNDGKLDLATIVEGRLKILKNQGPFEARSYLEVDLNGPDAVGSRVEVHAGGIVYTRDATVGRGLLMEDPMRLHFGLADGATIDSMSVRWGNGSTETYRDVPVDRIVRVREGGAVSSGAALDGTVTVAPNPFSDKITIGFRLAREAAVTLTIHTLDGKLVAALLNERLPAGDHDYVWDGRDGQGTNLSQGTYLYRLAADGTESRGTIVLVR